MLNKIAIDFVVHSVEAKLRFAIDFPSCGPAASRLYLEAFSYLCVYKQYAVHPINH